MQQVEAAVGHHHPLAGLAEPPQLALHLLDGEDFVFRGRAGNVVRQLVEDFLAGQGDDAKPLDFEAAGRVGHFDGGRIVGARGEHVAQGGQDHVAGAGDVADLPRPGGKEAGVARGVGPGHAVAVERDQRGIDAESQQASGGVEPFLRRRDPRAERPCPPRPGSA